MAYRIVPKEREDHQALDVPLHRLGGEKPTHHRAMMPHGGVIPKEGLVVTGALDPHYVRQQQRGEVEIVEGTLARVEAKDADGNAFVQEVFTPTEVAPPPQAAATEE